MAGRLSRRRIVGGVAAAKFASRGDLSIYCRQEKASVFMIFFFAKSTKGGLAFELRWYDYFEKATLTSYRWMLFAEDVDPNIYILLFQTCFLVSSFFAVLSNLSKTKFEFQIN